MKQLLQDINTIQTRNKLLVELSKNSTKSTDSLPEIDIWSYAFCTNSYVVKLSTGDLGRINISNFIDQLNQNASINLQPINTVKCTVTPTKIVYIHALLVTSPRFGMILNDDVLYQKFKMIEGKRIILALCPGILHSTSDSLPSNYENNEVFTVMWNSQTNEFMFINRAKLDQLLRSVVII